MKREKMKGKRSYEIQGRKRGDKMKKMKICTKETGNREKRKMIRVRRDRKERKKMKEKVKRGRIEKRNPSNLPGTCCSKSDKCCKEFWECGHIEK